MHARNFTTNVPKILDLKSSSEQIFFRKLSLGAPVPCQHMMIDEDYKNVSVFAIESQSKDESTSDRSVPYTQMNKCSMSSIYPATF